MAILDDLSCFIITAIWEASLENKEISTWSLADEFFSYDGETKNRELTKHATKILSRLKRMEKDKWIEIVNKKGHKDYIINTDKIFLKKITFPDGKRRDAVCVKDEKNRWMACQV